VKQVDHEELNHPFFLHDVLNCYVWVRFCATSLTY